MSECPSMDLINGMLEEALSTLGANDSLILHSDQGWQYQMCSHQTKLKNHGMVQSISRKGNCLDNAVVESFFGTLKAECFYLNNYKNIMEFKQAIEAYIHYNNECISLNTKWTKSGRIPNLAPFSCLISLSNLAEAVQKRRFYLSED
ncbi:hypothetical protein DOR57_23805 [Salmonella enterica subsp. salamae]|uniref:Integrase catalytic domain-containing protein n=1 Tax=Salmonella enterica subsp. enterica serovar Kottbus TaxID=224727 RepID=A0A5J0SGI1_SALET|nr:hypothetical protein [Salmonella enterica subsp. enterica serovar Kottbus]ECG0942865.1 hypothetical protein [Salmonella enterica subsp. salamae]EBS1862975.1 hypothetical protein [Salmonella enterica subsp. enterica serovar Kottbus]EBW1603233.1 hypothetical protein [Salmonella enterica subsp. enterica serovar Kottbus]EBW1732473.1 hypothetical protein [Salmonella enterica subsp. enterica serovar Kottbus]